MDFSDSETFENVFGGLFDERVKEFLKELPSQLSTN
jgi:hypothetical protein